MKYSKKNKSTLFTNTFNKAILKKVIKKMIKIQIKLHETKFILKLSSTRNYYRDVFCKAVIKNIQP